MIPERTRQLIVANAKLLELNQLANLSRDGAYIFVYIVSRQKSLIC